MCALLNSYVANYIIRLRVNTHVTVSLVSRLPVPVVQPGASALRAARAVCARRSTRGPAPVEQMDEYVEIQTIAAHLYRLSPAHFEHVLSRFPLVPGELRQTVLRRFIDFH